MMTAGQCTVGNVDQIAVDQKANAHDNVAAATDFTCCLSGMQEGVKVCLHCIKTLL